MSHVTQIVEILLVNFVLSGDNALVIALVTMRMDVRHRRRAILYGAALSVLSRVWLTLSARRVFGYPYLQGAGGLLLSYLACSLLLPDHGAAATVPEPAAAGSRRTAAATPASPGVAAAVAAITVADVTMSLDNAIALAGIARDDQATLIVGLVLSISLIMFASHAMARALGRSTVLQILGAAALAWTAGGMIGHDPVLERYFGAYSYVPVIGAFAVSAAAVRARERLRGTSVVWFAKRRARDGFTASGWRPDGRGAQPTRRAPR